MSHWAEIDEQYRVIRVLVGDDSLGEEAAKAWLIDNLGGTWIQCSYNNRIRKQYPGRGYTYDPDKDIFIAPRPFRSWTLDANGDWQPPVAMPNADTFHRWDETSKTWIDTGRRKPRPGPQP